MNIFYKLLINNLIAGIVNNFVWFALTFYIYLETRSVIATSIIAGLWAFASALLGMYFGSYVDHHKKKKAMVLSSLLSLAAFLIGGLMYLLLPTDALLDVSHPLLWVFCFILLFGTVAGNLRSIALSTCVTLLVPADRRDKANGLVGSTTGVIFSMTSIMGGLGIGFFGMGWSLIFAVALTVITTIHLLFINIPEDTIIHEAQPNSFDFRGAISAIKAVPGLMGLIFFSTINNFLGGVFMALMDPYGLSLVSVEWWGIMWGVVSLGFIAGGLIVAKKGLGPKPLQILFIGNIVMWITCIIFPLRSSIWLVAICMFVYMLLIPVVEASEQTVIQKVVPLKKQGRVFGFGQTLEQAVAPITALLIGPLAQLFFIPFMEPGGSGANSIGSWFGVGSERGLALVFLLAGIIGLVITLIAMRTNAYHLLSRQYAEN